MPKFWNTARRKFDLSEKILVMAILNVTPDSFSDGGRFRVLDDALRQAEKFIADGADIIDVGGESTRPDSRKVSADEEIRRIVPVVEAMSKYFDVALSIDTSKREVAEKAVEAGAEIINDISGLRFDERLAEVAAEHRTGLILMHLRGTFETMHKQPPVPNVLRDVADGLRQSIEKARSFGVADHSVALDVGIGFGKTFEQNLELLAKLDKIIDEFSQFPMLIGSSRKSFIGKILGGLAPEERLSGTLASIAVAIFNGAAIVRVHDPKEAVEVAAVASAIGKWKDSDEQNQFSALSNNLQDA